jgi:glutathione S-transferase
MEPTIFSSPDSYDSFVVRWIAYEKECPLEHRIVYSFEVTMDKLPNIQDRDLYIVSHEPLVQYLQERYPGEPLLPSDPKIRAQLRQICSMVRADGENIAKDVDSLLLHSGGEYITGNEFTLADIPAGTCLYRYFEMGVEVPRHSHIAQWYARLSDRVAYKAHVMVPFEELRGRLEF